MSHIKINPATLEALAGAGGMKQRFAAGEAILLAGDDAKEMFVVSQGTVEIKFNGETIEEVGEDGIFGEMAMIDYRKRSADVVAATECEIIPIDQRLFVILVQETPFFAFDVMKVLAERLRTMNTKLNG